MTTTAWRMARDTLRRDAHNCNGSHVRGYISLENGKLRFLGASQDTVALEPTRARTVGQVGCGCNQSRRPMAPPGDGDHRAHCAAHCAAHSRAVGATIGRAHAATYETADRPAIKAAHETALASTHHATVEPTHTAALAAANDHTHEAAVETTRDPANWPAL